MECQYCEKNAKLNEIMIHICKLPTSDVYFMKDQTYLGRCIVALNTHKEEIFEMDDEMRNSYFKDVNLVSSVLNNIYSPEKINIASYGDLVKHLHFHIVPKYKDSLAFGNPFVLVPEKLLILTEEDYQKNIEKIKKEIEKKL